MIGMGLGGGGGGDSAITTVGIEGGGAFMGWLGRFAGGWSAVDAAQRRAGNSAATSGNQATGAIRGQVGAVERLEKAWMGANRAKDRWNRASGGAGQVGQWMTGASGAAIAFGVASLKSANDFEESESLVRTTFGKNTADIVAWSQQRNKALGVDDAGQRRDAAGFQTQFKAGGFDASEATDLSKAFTEARDDLVSFYNVSDPGEVFRALQSGINGEAEPLRRFSIFASEAAVSAYAYKKGIAAVGAELSEQQKIRARAGFILEEFKKGSASGDLDRTKDSSANRLRASQVAIQKQVLEIGKSLQTIQADALDLFGDQVLPRVQAGVKWFTSLDETTRRWYLGLGLAVGPLTLIGGKLFGIVAAWKGLQANKLLLSLNDAKGAASGVAGGSNVATMTVRAGVVNISGGGAPGGGNPGGGAPGGKPGAGLPTTPAPKTGSGTGIAASLASYRASPAVATALGAGAAAGTQDDLRALGVDTGTAIAASAVTGIGVGLASMFVPGGAIAAAFAEAVRFGINEAYTAPLERDAAKGSGLDDKTVEKLPGMTRAQKSDAYLDKANEKATELRRIQELPGFGVGQAAGLGNVVGSDQWKARQLEMEIESLRRQAGTERQSGKREATFGSPEFLAKQERDQEAKGETPWRKRERAAFGIDTAAERRKAATSQLGAMIAPGVRGMVEPANELVGGSGQRRVKPVARRNNDDEVEVAYKIPAGPGEQTARAIQYLARGTKPKYVD